MLQINAQIAIPDDEIALEAIRAQGAGGQNVNKVATAIHLRFDIQASGLPDELKQRLLAAKDRRVSSDGVIVIKAQRFRSQDKNRQDALERLAEFIRKGLAQRKPRKSTKPTKASVRKRLDKKTKRSQTKVQRRRPNLD